MPFTSPAQSALDQINGRPGGAQWTPLNKPPSLSS